MERMFKDNPRFGSALCPGCADKILTQHLKHAAACESHNVGSIDHTEGYGGKCAVIWIVLIEDI